MILPWVTEMFDAVTNRLGLQKLRGVDQRIEIIRIQEELLHVIHDLAVGGSISLMLLHHIGKDIPVLRNRKRLHRANGRK